MSGNAAARREIGGAFTLALLDRCRVTADEAIHARHRNGGDRNHRAHMLSSTRLFGADGFEKKARAFDAAQTGRIGASRDQASGLAAARPEPGMATR